MSARLTAEQRYLRTISEAVWQSSVLQIAHSLGWRSYAPPANSPRVSRRGTTYVQNVRAGWPDLALVRGPRLVMAELKTETGPLGPGQQDWLDALAHVPGVETYLWRPSDRPTVLQVLA